MKAIYTATSDAHEDEKDQRPHYWVSYDPDNEGWLEVTALPESIEQYDDVVKLFGPHETVRNGKKTHFSHLRMATRGIRLFCKNPVFHEPITEKEPSSK